MKWNERLVLDRAKRDARILAMRDAGMTLAYIGEAEGLTKEGVRKVLLRLDAATTKEEVR